MPTILIAFAVFALLTLCCWICVVQGWGPTELAFTAALAGSLASVCLLGISLIGPQLPPLTEQTTRFTIEKTSYRIVISAFELERTYKEALVVAQVGDIVAVRKVTQRNAWGVSLASKPYEPTLEVVFREVAP